MPVPNVVKYSPTTVANSIKKNNVVLGINDVDYAPTNSTGYWNGISPPVGGYTIYTVPSGSTTPSIVCPSMDYYLKYFAKSYGGTNVNSTNNALSYIMTAQTNIAVVNYDYGNIITSGLTLVIDGGFTSSYPREGNIVYDMSGNLNNGTLVNNPVFTANTATGGGLYFNSSSSQSINFGNILNYTTSDFSFSFWVYFNSLTTNTSGQGPILFYKGALQTNGYYCQVSTGGTISFVTNQAGASQTTSTSATSVTGYSWYNIAITRSGTSVRIYVNGVDSTSSAGSHTNPSSSSSDFTIATNSTTYSTISIGNFMNYNRNLNSTEVLRNYNSMSEYYNSIFIAGVFSALNGSPTNNIYGFDFNGDLYPGVSFGTGAQNGIVDKILYDSSGNIWLSGYFDTYSGSTLFYFGKLANNGSISSSFTNYGFDFYVYDFLIDSNNKIVVGGIFSSYSGISYNYLIRLNQNGTIDNTFVIGSGFNSSVNALAIDTNNKILVGGGFTSYNGTAYDKVIRLNSDGSIDTSFVSGGFSVGSSVSKILIDSNQKILLFGGFTTYSGASASNIVRLNSDGSIDSTFVTGSGFDSSVLDAEIDSNNKIVAVGFFTSYSGVSSNGIIRLNTNGSVDNTFSIGTGFNSTTRTIKILSNGEIFVGGSFTTYNGVVTKSIVLIKNDGSQDTTFIAPSFRTSTIYTIAVQSDINILIGGLLTQYGGSNVSGSNLSLNRNGTNNSFYNMVSQSGTIYSLAKNSTNKIIIAGSFTNGFGAGGPDNFMRMNYDGTRDFSFRATLGNGYAIDVVIDSSDKIYVGGTFTYYSPNNSQPRLVRALSNGAYDSSFNVGTGCNLTVWKLKLDSSGKLLIGGEFTTYNGTSKSRVARINTNGSLDTTFTASSNSTIYAIETDTNGNVLLGGNFTTMNSLTNNKIVRVNSLGDIDNTFSAGTGFNNIVYTVAIDSNSKILVGGTFTTYNGSTYNRIIRLNSDGSVDSSFLSTTGFNSTVYEIVVKSDGKIFVVGDFTTYNGNTCVRVVRLNSDGSVDTTFNMGYGVNSTVYTIIN